MRTVSTLLAVALTSPAAVASASPSGRTCTCNAKPSLSLEQMHALEGVYRLPEGKILRLVVVDDRLYGEIDREHRRRQLVPVDSHRLASRDGKITMSYEPLDDDHVRLSFAE